LSAQGYTWANGELKGFSLKGLFAESQCRLESAIPARERKLFSRHSRVRNQRCPGPLWAGRWRQERTRSFRERGTL